MFLPCPSVHGGQTIFLSTKNVSWGFQKVWSVFDVFDFCPCVRACLRYALCTKFCGLNLS